jgi:hyperosmotically inducible protein
MSSAVLIAALILPVTGYAVEVGVKTESASPITFVKDSIITTKIKAAMAKDKQVSALNIKVDTDDKGVVTLSGKARNKAEAEKAVLLAHSVNGVVSVHNNIQITAN